MPAENQYLASQSDRDLAFLKSWPPVIQKSIAFLAHPLVRRALPTLLISLILGAGAVVFVLSQSSNRQLFSSLPEADRAAVVNALQTGNYKFKIEDSTGAITVPASEYHKTRMALAALGLPKSATGGYDLLKDMPIGTSRAMEQARLKQSQEAELANSIAEISAVTEARIHLALPEPSVFVRDQAKPSASVFVKLAPGRILAEEHVQSIVYLVASSVPGMAPDRVSIVDQLGNLLTSTDGNSSFSESQKRLDYQRRVDAQYRERLAALLTPLVGLDNFTAEVHVDLDFTEQQQTRESFDKNNAVLRSERADDTSDGQTTPSGIPGALSNIAPPTPQVTSATSTPTPVPTRVDTRRAESYTRNYEVGKEVSVSKPAVGNVQRLSVAVVLRAAKNIKPANMQAIEQLVKNTIGFSTTRGDIVTVSIQPFAPVAEIPGTTWYKSDWIRQMVPTLLSVGVVSLLFLFGLRPLLKRVMKTASEVGNISSSQQPEQLSNTDSTHHLISAQANGAPGNYDDKVVMVKNLVSQDTARASNVFKQMLQPADESASAHV